MSGHVEIIKDSDSYTLRSIPDFNCNSEVDFEIFKPKPIIVLMRETDIITQFIQSELKKFADLTSNSTDTDEPSANLSSKSQHPFIMRSVIHPKRHDIYAWEGEGERIVRALAVWADTPLGREMFFGGEEEEDEGADKVKDTDNMETFDSSINNTVLEVSVLGPITFAGQVMVPKPGFEAKSQPGKPATVISFSDAAIDMLDDMLEKGNNEEARKMYESWAQCYNYLMYEH